METRERQWETRRKLGVPADGVDTGEGWRGRGTLANGARTAALTDDAGVRTHGGGGGGKDSGWRRGQLDRCELRQWRRPRWLTRRQLTSNL